MAHRQPLCGPRSHVREQRYTRRCYTGCRSASPQRNGRAERECLQQRSRSSAVLFLTCLSFSNVGRRPHQDYCRRQKVTPSVYSCQCYTTACSASSFEPQLFNRFDSIKRTRNSGFQSFFPCLCEPSRTSSIGPGSNCPSPLRQQRCSASSPSPSASFVILGRRL